MTITIPLTELRPKLPQIMEQVSKYLDRCVITRHGKPEAVILSEEDYESLLETLDILSDQKVVKEIRQAQKDFKAGKGIPWETVKKKLGYV
jgi:prevent-host-death family protein